MNMDKQTKAKKLFLWIGEIDDSFLEETELVNAGSVVRKRLVRYSTWAAAASVGIAVTYWWFKSKTA